MRLLSNRMELNFRYPSANHRALAPLVVLRDDFDEKNVPALPVMHVFLILSKKSNDYSKIQAVQ